MLEIMQRRRSIRKYKNSPIEKEKLDKLVKAGLLAPSARALYPHQYVVIEDKELLEKLAQSKTGGSAFLKGAAAGIVVLANPEISDVWIEDTSLSSIYIILEAEKLGLASCWIQIRERKHDSATMSEDYIKSVINIPKNYKVESIISLGYPDEIKLAHTDDELKYDNVFYNTYNNKYKK
ncbi:MAG: nitroreductase family protein [Eubacteriales bacterium]